MLRKTTNPPMPKQEMTRQKTEGLRAVIEGEDFTLPCPDWCEPCLPAERPTQSGWYLAVSLIQPDYQDTDHTDVSKIEADLVYLDYNSQLLFEGEVAWKVYERPFGHPAKREDFWWVGKVKVPTVEKPK